MDQKAKPSPPKITDRPALLRQRERALRRDPALFLQEEAACEVEERLNEVNRAFKNPAIITGWPNIWQNRIKNAEIFPDTETLTLKPGAHDLVIHALNLHWASDPVGQMIQSLRALRPDGMFIATLFGGQTLAALRSHLASAESALTGGLSARILPMAEIRDLGALLQRAGFALPVADATPYNVTYANTMALMHDLRAMGEANAQTARPRRFSRRAVIEHAAAQYDATAGDDGRITAMFEVITLTGWAPGPGQQQPLRPGTALTSLEEAIGAA